MKLILENVAKKFGSHFLFENLNKTLALGESWAVTGKNGSGKSTLLQILAGTQQTTKGKVSYEVNQFPIEPESWFKHLSIAAPYLSLLEELTLEELLNYHFMLKPMMGTPNELLEFSLLEEHKKKNIKNFSSGMKQRLKLALVFKSGAPVLLLDEPTSNLDEKFSDWYLNQIQSLNRSKEKIIVVFSNLSEEYAWCDEVLNL